MKYRGKIKPQKQRGDWLNRGDFAYTKMDNVNTEFTIFK